jgi:hypothetical protein
VVEKLPNNTWIPGKLIYVDRWTTERRIAYGSGPGGAYDVPVPSYAEIDIPLCLVGHNIETKVPAKSFRFVLEKANSGHYYAPHPAKTATFDRVVQGLRVTVPPLPIQNLNIVFVSNLNEKALPVPLTADMLKPEYVLALDGHQLATQYGRLEIIPNSVWLTVDTHVLKEYQKRLEAVQILLSKTVLVKNVVGNVLKFCADGIRTSIA